MKKNSSTLQSLVANTQGDIEPDVIIFQWKNHPTKSDSSKEHALQLSKPAFMLMARENEINRKKDEIPVTQSTYKCC